MDIRCQTTQIAISFAQSENILVSFVALKWRICQFRRELMEPEVCSCSCGEMCWWLSRWMNTVFRAHGSERGIKAQQFNRIHFYVKNEVKIQDKMKRDHVSCRRCFRGSVATPRSCWRILPTLGMPNLKDWWFSAGELTTMTTRTEGSWENKGSTGSSMIGRLMFQASL